jgi:hypothetical protein
MSAPYTYANKDKALENLEAHRRLRENADERWERSIAAAVAMGASLREVADVAGVSHTQVRRIAEKHRLTLVES